MVELVNRNSIYYATHGITLVAYLPNIMRTRNVSFFKFSFGLLCEKNLLFKFDHRLFYRYRRFRDNKGKPHNTLCQIKIV